MVIPVFRKNDIDAAVINPGLTGMAVAVAGKGLVAGTDSCRGASDHFRQPFYADVRDHAAGVRL